MATPTRPTGCLQATDFQFDIRSADKEKFYIYAIVDCSRVPSEWDNNKTSRPRRLSLSRAVSVTGTRNYRDTVLFYGGETESYIMADGDYTSASGYQTFEDSREAYRPQYGSALGNSREYGVLEFILWDEDNAAPTSTCHLAAVACEAINDEAFAAPGASTRQHVERCPDTFSDDYFVSSYHMQWCLATSINRCAYEDRMSYCWPVFADRTIAPS
jgi:hypothetical protein